MDFADPYQDKLSLPALLQAFGKAGKKEELHKADTKKNKPVEKRDPIAEAEVKAAAATAAAAAAAQAQAEDTASIKSIESEYRPPVTSTRGVVSALDSLPPEEREKLLSARRVDSEKVTSLIPFAALRIFFLF